VYSIGHYTEKLEKERERGGGGTVSVHLVANPMSDERVAA